MPSQISWKLRKTGLYSLVIKCLEFILLYGDGSLSKLNLLNQIYNFMLIITNHCRQQAFISLSDNCLHLQKSKNESQLSNSDTSQAGFKCYVWCSENYAFIRFVKADFADQPRLVSVNLRDQREKDNYFFRKSIAYLRVVSICSQIG